jgi:biopolymer transport protein ExbB/TolQ
MQHAAGRSARSVRRQMGRGLSGLATVAATAPFLGMFGTVVGIVNSFVGCDGEKSVRLAAVVNLLSQSMIPAAYGLALAIVASWGYKHLSARLSEFDREMCKAVSDLPIVRVRESPLACPPGQRTRIS